MFATDMNDNGKMYDSLGRFRLHIVIDGSTNDPTTRILARMRSGTVVTYSSLEAANKAKDDFLTDARPVANGGELSTYGIVAVVDTRDSVVHSCESITGEKEKTPRL